MVLGPLAILVLLGAPLVLGAGCLRLFGITPKTAPIAFGAWAWLVGSLGAAAVTFVWAWSGPDISSANVPLAVTAGLGLACFALARARNFERIDAVEPPVGTRLEVWLFRVALLIVLAITIERVAAASRLGIVLTDEGQFWSLRAKLLFTSGGFGPAYAEEARVRGLDNADYPLYSSLLHLLTYAQAGRITHVVDRLPVHMSSIALVLALAGALRRFARPGIAALLLLLLPTMDEAVRGASLAMCDVPVALGALVALDAYLRRRDDRRDSWIVLGGVALAFASFSKHEGTAIAFAALCGASLAAWRSPARATHGMRARAALLLVAPLALALLVTWRVNAHFGALNLFLHNLPESDLGTANREGSFATNFVAHFPDRALSVLSYFTRRVFFDGAHSRFLLPLFAALALLHAPRLRAASLLGPAVAIGCAVLGLTLVFIGLPKDLDYHLSTAATRVGFQPVPAVMLWLAVAAARLRIAPQPVARGLCAAAAIGTILAVAGPLRVLVSRAPDTLRHAFTESENERVVARLERIEANVGARPGIYAEVYGAIAERVAEDERVFVSVARNEHVQLLHSLRNLSYPRSYVIQISPGPEISDDAIRSIAGTAWGLDLCGFDERLAPYLARIEGGEDWSLWR